MSTSRVEFNQNSISEFKARMKRGYQAKTTQGRVQAEEKQTMPVEDLVSAQNKPAVNPERIFTHIPARTESGCSYTDPFGAKRAYHYRYQKIMTQSCADYKVISVKNALDIEKNMLTQHMDKFQSVLVRLKSLAYVNGDANQIKNQEYVAPTVKINALYIVLRSRLAVLEACDGENVSHEQMLEVLKACENDILEAKEDGVLAQPRGAVRKIPVLNLVCRFLDVMGNYFAFLDKKIGKTLTGDFTPVFEGQGGFVAGMFKPAATSTLKELDKLLSDVHWYQNEITQLSKRYGA